MNPYVEIMRSLLASTSLTKQEAFAAFADAIVTTDEAEFVWNAFDPQVRDAQLQRYYDRAVWLINQEDQKTAPPATPDSPPTATVTPPAPPVSRSPVISEPPRRPTASATPPYTGGKKRGNIGMDRISLDMVGDGPGKRPAYHCMTDHRGVLFSKLTRIGLLNYRGASPAMNLFAQSLAERMPMTNRSIDIVEKVFTPTEANRLWEEAKEQTSAYSDPIAPATETAAPSVWE